MTLVPLFCRRVEGLSQEIGYAVLLDWTGHREKIQSNSKSNTRVNSIYKLGSYLVSDSHSLICVAWLCSSCEKMGKQIVPVKSVIYALSPFQQKIMPGLWKDLPTKIHHKVSENWISATLLLGPLVGTYA